MNSVTNTFKLGNDIFILVKPTRGRVWFNRIEELPPLVKAVVVNSIREPICCCTELYIAETAALVEVCARVAMVSFIFTCMSCSFPESSNDISFSEQVLRSASASIHVSKHLQFHRMECMYVPRIQSSVPASSINTVLPTCS